MKRRRLIVVGVGLAVLGGGAVMAQHVLSSPASGTVQRVATKPAANHVTTTKKFDGTYASYTYPVALTEQPHPDSISPVLDRQWFARGNLTGWQLSVTVYDLPSNQVKDNGDYNLRLTMPDRFKATNSGKAMIFADTTAGSFNKVAFIHDGDRLAAVALTGAAGTDNSELNDVLKGIVDSWQFKR